MNDPNAKPPGPAVEAADIEQWVVEYLRKEFPRVEVRPDTSFNAIGLDSMVAVELTGALEARLRRTVPPTLLYEVDTPREVAAYLARSPGPPSEGAP